ncbi:LexA family transcriptional regulator [Rhodobacter sp. NTK016B]|uniref:LexA family transcriptional regulator n=1 Tax=Rhodobacter sp. NTK016B TaxID=2759676 RepID=UPI001A8D5FFF|nr:LexA family transcriptional regulator [Rhodobacter sp. NTK016B]MBN8294702.1 LexA family transcriptional regulator [Rhodobacter sp. NTK016B]
MQSPIQIFQALEARRLELGLSQAEVGARAFGKPDNAAFQALRRGSSPSVEKLAALCGAVGWEFYFGPPRESLDAELAAARADEFAQIPVHDASLAAGGGFMNGSEDPAGHLAFKRTWLRRIGVSASVAVLARADGESMAPTIHDGDMLLIDRSRSELPTRQRDPKDARRAQIFAFLDDGAARVKRIELAPGDSLVLLSDNPAFAPEFRPIASISVIGRVMWWGHTNSE